MSSQVLQLKTLMVIVSLEERVVPFDELFESVRAMQSDPRALHALPAAAPYFFLNSKIGMNGVVVWEEN